VLNSLSDTHLSEHLQFSSGYEFSEPIRLNTWYIILLKHFKCYVSHSVL